MQFIIIGSGSVGAAAELSLLAAGSQRTDGGAHQPLRIGKGSHHAHRLIRHACGEGEGASLWYRAQTG